MTRSDFGTPGPTFPLNAWYAVCWDLDVSRSLLHRRVAGRSLVLYRKADKTVAALEDACWHRLAPLSRGKLVGDDVQCPYHGLRYDSDGRCTFMPAQPTINPSASVRAYPVVERHRFVWIWPGDPALSDPALIPDMHWNDDAAWAADGSVIDAAVDYRLVIDNLMDLTHEEFIHPSSIGNDALSTAELEVTHTDTSITVTRWMLGIEAPPLWRDQLAETFPGYDGPVDRWQIIRFAAPSVIVLDVGVAIAGTGAPEGDRSKGISGRTMNAITPVGPQECIYLWSFARDWAIDQQRLTTQLREGVVSIFREDEEMLLEQQRGINEHPDHEFYDLNIDAGGMWARRLISRMVAAESADAPTF
jgi:vanillate O-demethylase monooxygenase subunit